MYEIIILSSCKVILATLVNKKKKFHTNHIKKLFRYMKYISFLKKRTLGCFYKLKYKIKKIISHCFTLEVFLLYSLNTPNQVTNDLSAIIAGNTD